MKGAFLWIDLEMTGLFPEKDRILEAAVLVTTAHLEILGEWETVVFQPPEVLASMDPWCVQHHGQSGLTARVPGGMTEDALDERLCAFAGQYFTGPIVLAGNSIHQDRKFIDRYLPRFAPLLHYRMLDVSSLKIVFTQCLTPPRSFFKQNQHRAMDDIRESIRELSSYLSHIPGGPVPEREGGKVFSQDRKD